jgi:hypothetical protein
MCAIGVNDTTPNYEAAIVAKNGLRSRAAHNRRAPPLLAEIVIHVVDIIPSRTCASTASLTHSILSRESCYLTLRRTSCLVQCCKTTLPASYDVSSCSLVSEAFRGDG